MKYKGTFANGIRAYLNPKLFKNFKSLGSLLDLMFKNFPNRPNSFFSSRLVVTYAHEEIGEYRKNELKGF